MWGGFRRQPKLMSGGGEFGSLKAACSQDWLPHEVRLPCVENECGDDSGGGGEARVAVREPARASLHLAEIGVRMDVHLHLAEFQVAEAHEREDRADRIDALLHYVRRAHGLLEGALPFGGIHLPTEVGVDRKSTRLNSSHL